MKNYYTDKLLLVGWITLGILIFFSSLREQVFISRFWQKKIGMVFPEGWSFFTKSPREQALYIYRIDEGKELHEMPVSNHENPAFGFSRTSRLIGYEASMIANKIEPDAWVKYLKRDVHEFIDDSVHVVPKEPLFNHLVPGDYIMKLIHPIPFAWADRKQEENNPFLIARIRIQ